MQRLDGTRHTYRLSMAWHTYRCRGLPAYLLLIYDLLSADDLAFFSASPEISLPRPAKPTAAQNFANHIAFSLNWDDDMAYHSPSRAVEILSDISYILFHALMRFSPGHRIIAIVTYQLIRLKNTYGQNAQIHILRATLLFMMMKMTIIDVIIFWRRRRRICVIVSFVYSAAF